ncbi:hypothetical protein BKE38_12300 [Pseudoroseomonas deserti]|uniref:Peptidase C39 domain-containing protein n=1 Tax=Teichococcus deserti TaxID=1817963 RepID=A0A1V2H3E8_9PROT|nr:hypothetical protein [Pseudoroseomonas deserti]ONG53387.1 hypothetical protein BKE38_12300 [Pseudoroseomonas deserti]
MVATIRPLPPQEAGRRSAEALAAERGGNLGWCGPAAVALAGGTSYAMACALLRAVAPQRYAPEGEIVTAYWRDVVQALAELGVVAERLPLTAPRPTLLGLARRSGLAPGLYLVRVTGHFLLLRLQGFGLAEVNDNRLSNAVLTARTHGRCRVTHVARLAEADTPA